MALDYSRDVVWCVRCGGLDEGGVGDVKRIMIESVQQRIVVWSSPVGVSGRTSSVTV